MTQNHSADNSRMSLPEGTQEGSERGQVSGSLSSFLIPAAFVTAIVLFLVSIQAGAESAAADVANLLPIGFAFAAGMVASVNPCGFLLLPTYISYQLGNQESEVPGSSSIKRLLKALLLGVVATSGFILVTGIVGVIIAAGGQWLITVFPYAGLIIGGAMVLLGIWLLATRRNLGIMAASRLTISPRRNLGNVFLFGIVYAGGSLSCTLPIFLVVVGSSLGTQGFISSFGQFLSYGLGMGVILILAMVGTALFRGIVLRWIKAAIPYVSRASAMFLIGAGGYLLYYWIFFADAIF